MSTGGLGQGSPFYLSIGLRGNSWEDEQRDNGRPVSLQAGRQHTHMGLFRASAWGRDHRNEAGPSSIHYAVDSGCSAHLRGQKQALPTARLAASHLPPLLTTMPVTEAFLGHFPKARE